METPRSFVKLTNLTQGGCVNARKFRETFTQGASAKADQLIGFTQGTCVKAHKFLEAFWF